MSANGQYSLVSANEFESAAVLYKGSFDPSNPLANLVKTVNQGDNVVRSTALNNLPYLDDATGASRIDIALEAGVQYYFVTTAFNYPGVEIDGGPFVGRYNNLITPASNFGGVVSLGLLPEPATVSALGLAGLFARRRRG